MRGGEFAIQSQFGETVATHKGGQQRVGRDEPCLWESETILAAQGQHSEAGQLREKVNVRCALVVGEIELAESLQPKEQVTSARVSPDLPDVSPSHSDGWQQSTCEFVRSHPLSPGKVMQVPERRADLVHLGAGVRGIATPRLEGEISERWTSCEETELNGICLSENRELEAETRQRWKPSQCCQHPVDRCDRVDSEQRIFGVQSESQRRQLVRQNERLVGREIELEPV